MLFPIFEWGGKREKVWGGATLCWDECADSHDVGKTRQGGGHCAGFQRMMIRKANNDGEIFKDEERFPTFQEKLKRKQREQFEKATILRCEEK